MRPNQNTSCCPTWRQETSTKIESPPSHMMRAHPECSTSAVSRLASAVVTRFVAGQPASHSARSTRGSPRSSIAPPPDWARRVRHPAVWPPGRKMYQPPRIECRAPSSPPVRNPRTACTSLRKRWFMPTSTALPARSRAARIRSMPSAVRASGRSHKTSTPAERAVITCTSCRWFGVQITTASGCEYRSRSSMSSYTSATSNRPARARALGTSMSQIPASSTSLIRPSAGKCAICAMAPAPTTPTRSGSLTACPGAASGTSARPAR